MAFIPLGDVGYGVTLGSLNTEYQNLSVTDQLRLGSSGRFLSANYSAGSTGFLMEADGTVELNNATFRGTIYATAGEIGDLSVTGDLTIDTTGSLIAGSATNNQLIITTENNSGVLRWNDYFASPLEAPSVQDPYILTSVDGDTLGSYPADTNSILEIRAAEWTGIDTAWLRLNGDNWTSGSNPYFQVGIGAHSNTLFTVATNEITTELQLQGINGSSSAPSFAFTNDPDSGVYRWASNELGIAAGGTAAARITTSYITSGINSTGAWRLKHDAVGGATAPTYAFFNDSNTGMYRVAADVVGLVAGGTHGVRVGSSNFRSIDSTTGNMSVKINGAGAYDAPTYSFVGNTGTGMFRYSSNVIGFSASSLTRVWISTSQLRMLNSVHLVDAGPNNVGGSATAKWTSIGGGAYRLDWTGSARRFKKNIVDADLADIELSPKRYDWRTTDKTYYGLIAEDLADQDSTLGVYNEEGELTDYDTRGVLAVLAAKINRLERQLAAK